MWKCTAYTEMDRNTSTKRDTLQKMELEFSTHFGTYKKDDTVKITEVFELLRKIKEALTEETPYDKN